ncbi:MAG: carboxypeptidase-like regulatory domain-containing protein, partial [Gemmatimonadota bacterium]
MTSTCLRSARLCAATVVGLALLALAVPGRAQEADTIPLPDTTEAADTVEIGPRAPGVDTTANFTGTVASAKTGKPISGARVSIPEIQYGAITDEEGRFTIKKLPPGLYDVRVHYLGYTTNQMPIRLQPGRVTNAT